MNELVNMLQQRVRSEIDMGTSLDDKALMERIVQVVLSEGKRQHYNYSFKNQLCKEVFDSIRGYDVLQELIEDPRVSEIMVNGYSDIFIEREGKILRWDRQFSSREKLMDIIQQIVAGVNRVVNETSPIVDARLADGSRVNIVLPPVALDGPVITIRKFPDDPVTMEQLIRWGSVTEEAVEFLKELIRSRYNIFISGGTGAGKTTFLNALSECIPKSERIITIEDSAELKLSIPNLVRMEARNKNLEGQNAIPIRELIRTALRMRPDRIIVGEVRADEALDMLQAMNTGHDGSFSTGHANSSSDMLTRLEVMVLMAAELPLDAIRSQIASAIDILIHLERFRDGSRKVVSIEEITGYEDGKIKLSILYKYDKEKNCLEKTGESLRNLWKLEKNR